MMTAHRDIWADWVLKRRFGSREHAERFLAKLVPVRDRLLDHAELADGETLLDVGCGDGFIGFGALARRPTARVIFSDVSQDLLDRALGLASDAGVADSCRFLKAPVEDLSAVDTDSVDVVTMRSVLIYVEAKEQALRECYRVLKSGGRLAVFEPVNGFRYPEPANLLWGYDVSPVGELAQRIKRVYQRIQDPARDPMFDFDERSLLAHAEKAGFAEVHVDARFESRWERSLLDWDTLTTTAGNPRIPTLLEAMDQALTPNEHITFTAHLRPLVESSPRKVESEVVYLSATK